MDFQKLHDRLEHMMEYESDDFFTRIMLKPDVSQKLYDYQQFHLFNMLTAMRNNNCVLDGSDTGTGKTYTTVAICRQLNLQPFIICPKMIISAWKNVCQHFGVIPLHVTNYEAIKAQLKKEEDHEYFSVDAHKNLKWKLPRNAVIVFDEVHKCKNHKTLNGKLLATCKDQRRVILLSATLCDKPQHFEMFGWLLGCYKQRKQGKNWINGVLYDDRTSLSKISSLHKHLYPKHGAQMNIRELGDKFPNCQVTADAYDVSETIKSKVNALFTVLNDTTIQGDSKVLYKIIRARQELELHKLNTISELTQQYHEAGYSVVIFLNYTNSIYEMAKKIKTDCIISGVLTVEERERNIQRFQENECHTIICNVDAGGTSISLHDINGRPRVSLISPPMSSVTLLQVLGRIHRAGSKSPALQRLIFCADTCEEIICNKLREKLNFLDKLNYDDLAQI